MHDQQIILGIRSRLTDPIPPSSESAVRRAEANLGFSLPGLLRELYLKVGNGGFGPGYGVLGLSGGHLSDEGDTIDELYKNLSGYDPEDPSWKWPEGMLPFCHWGCAIYSCIDTGAEGQPVVWFDPNLREIGQPMQIQYMKHRESLESWFQAWLEGEDLRAETYGDA